MAGNGVSSPKSDSGEHALSSYLSGDVSALERSFQILTKTTGKLVLAVTLTVLLAVFVRLCVGAGPHSGQATPPMFGDYEVCLFILLLLVVVVVVVISFCLRSAYILVFRS